MLSEIEGKRVVSNSSRHQCITHSVVFTKLRVPGVRGAGAGELPAAAGARAGPGAAAAHCRGRGWPRRAAGTAV